MAASFSTVQKEQNPGPVCQAFLLQKLIRQEALIEAGLVGFTLT
jgi:hypothetical protein